MRSIKKAAFGCALACALVCGTAQANDFGFSGFWSWFGLFGTAVEQVSPLGSVSWHKADQGGSGGKADQGGSGEKADQGGSGKE
jgi:hypothetical protein